MAYNVLVVDDSLPMRAVIKKAVRASGFKVGKFFDAANGREALSILRQEWLDLVLTDYNMPDMDGMELLKEMKKDELLKTIPVVVISIDGSQQRIREFIKRGAVDYINKHFRPEETKDKLNHVMGGAAYGEGFHDRGHDDFDF